MLVRGVGGLGGGAEGGYTSISGRQRLRHLCCLAGVIYSASFRLKRWRSADCSSGRHSRRRAELPQTCRLDITGINALGFGVNIFSFLYSEDNIVFWC